MNEEGSVSVPYSDIVAEYKGVIEELIDEKVKQTALAKNLNKLVSDYRNHIASQEIEIQDLKSRLNESENA